MMSKKYIVLVVVGVAVSAVAVFFAQKYLRLYFDYRELAAVTKKEQSFGDYLKNRAEGEKQVQQAIETHEATLEALRQDTVGGKTPEETLAGFVGALKTRDFDLASKYFWLDKQEEWKGSLKNREEESLLNEMVSDLEDAPTKWERSGNENSLVYTYKKYFEEQKVQLPDGKGGFIEQLMPAGEYNQEIYFEFNSYSDVWKISRLNL